LVKYENNVGVIYANHNQLQRKLTNSGRVGELLIRKTTRVEQQMEKGAGSACACAGRAELLPSDCDDDWQSKKQQVIRSRFVKEMNGMRSGKQVVIRPCEHAHSVRMQTALHLWSCCRPEMKIAKDRKFCLKGKLVGL
jgi:hypothetical protein